MSMRRPHALARLALSAAAVALLVLASPALRAQSAPRLPPGELERRLQRLGQLIDRERDSLHIPGLALGIVMDDRPVLLAGYGLADVETGRAVAADTLFAIGSSTKAFTATLCAMLVDAGQLAWDDPIAKSVPEFALHADPGPGAPWGAAPVITLRDVLSHRTGFSRNDVLWAGNTVPRETILRTAAQAESWAPYRTQFLYNNVQVMAAGVAAGRLAGTTWDALLARRLLAPLHMGSTTSSITACAGDPRLALGYAWEDDKHAFRHLPMRNLDAIAPAGAINSNVTDMAQWLRLLLGGGAWEGQRLVSAAALEETWSPQVKVGGNSYGLCWFLEEWEGHRVVQHGGNIDGFAAQVALLPDDGIGFVLLANVSATPLQHASQAMVFDALLGAEPEPAVAAGTDDSDDAHGPDDPGGPHDANSARPATSTTAAVASAVMALQEYVGAYTCNSPSFRDVDFHVLVKDGRLALDVPGQTVYTLRAPDAKGRWRFELTGSIEVDFQRGADGAVRALTMYQSGLALEMPKAGVPPQPDEPLEPLARLLGEYASPGQRMTVVLHNQRLALDVPGQMIYELAQADGSGRRAFRAISGFSAEFVEQDGAVVAVVSHQPNGDFRFERASPESPAGQARPDLAAVRALRGASVDASAWEALGGWRLTGSMRFANAGLAGTITSSFRGSDHVRDETDFGAYGFARQASDGVHAQTESVFNPWRELDGRELRQSLQTPLVLLGDWSRRFADVRVLRRDALDGRDVVVVELRDGELPPTTAYLAADTGDVLRVDSEELLPGAGSIPQTTTFSDWRDVSRADAAGPALRFPFRAVTKSEATGRIEVQYESAETGLSLPDELFRLPPPAQPAELQPAPAPAPVK
ncbi:MAG TPA: serine hydrolase domain-containing protein [Planctomycetota bacterium]|nr:serine hydrolase domain-containing protein [Planctomycetota bacterium]